MFELCLKKGVSSSYYFFDPNTSLQKLYSSKEISELDETIHSIEKIQHTFIPSFGEDVIEDYQSISQVRVTTCEPSEINYDENNDTQVNYGLI